MTPRTRNFKRATNRVARNLAQYDLQRAEAVRGGQSQEIHKAQCTAVIQTWAEVRDLTWNDARIELHKVINAQQQHQGSQF